MRAARTLALGILISMLSLGAINSVSAHRQAGGPCPRAGCPPAPPPQVAFFSAPVVDQRIGSVFMAVQPLVKGQPHGRGAVLMLDGARGTLLHRSTVGTFVRSTVGTFVPYFAPLVVDSAMGRIIVATYWCVQGQVFPCHHATERISVLDAQTGGVLWSLPDGVTTLRPHDSGEVNSLVDDSQGGRVILLSCRGVRVLDLSARTLSTWTPVPGCARSAALDDQVGHIVVSSTV